MLIAFSSISGFKCAVTSTSKAVIAVITTSLAEDPCLIAFMAWKDNDLLNNLYIFLKFSVPIKQTANEKYIDCQVGVTVYLSYNSKCSVLAKKEISC